MPVEVVGGQVEPAAHRRPEPLGELQLERRDLCHHELVVALHRLDQRDSDVARGHRPETRLLQDGGDQGCDSRFAISAGDGDQAGVEAGLAHLGGQLDLRADGQAQIGRDPKDRMPHRDARARHDQAGAGQKVPQTAVVDRSRPDVHAHGPTRHHHGVVGAVVDGYHRLAPTGEPGGDGPAGDPEADHGHRCRLGVPAHPTPPWERKSA
jgi:hypothetical protein